MDQPSEAPVPAEVEELGWLVPLRQAHLLNLPLSQLYTKAEAHSMVETLVQRRRFLDAKPLVETFKLHAALSWTALKELTLHARSVGYLAYAHKLAKTLAVKSQKGIYRSLAEDIGAMLEQYKEAEALLPPLWGAQAGHPMGPVLHVAENHPDLDFSDSSRRLKFALEATVKGQRHADLALFQEEVPADPVVLSQGDMVPVRQAGPALPRTGSIREWLESSAQTLQTLVREQRPSLLHVHGEPLYGLLAVHVGQALKIPVLYEALGVLDDDLVSRLRATQYADSLDDLFAAHGTPDIFNLRQHHEARVCRSATHTIYPSAALRSNLLTDAQAGTLLPSSFPPHLALTASRTPALSKELGLPENCIVVGALSPGLPSTEAQLLINAVRILQRDPTRTMLPVVLLLNEASGIPHDGKDSLKQIGVEGRTVSASSYPELAEYYSALDIAVSPFSVFHSSEAKYPADVAEAMAAGRPLLTPHHETLPPLPVRHELGITEYTHHDPEHLARQIAILVNDQALRERHGRLNRKAMESTWADSSAVYEKLYAELTSGEEPSQENSG